MATKRFQLIHSNGAREHIDTATRDSLLIAGQITPLDAFRYKAAKPRILSNLADLAQLNFTSKGPVQHFLPGTFIFEHKQKRHTERLETPEALAIRIQTAANDLARA